MFEKEELLRTDDVYVIITDMETFDYVEGRILVFSGDEDEKGFLFCNLSVYYRGVLHVDSPSWDIAVPQPEVARTGHALYYRFYDAFTPTIKDLFLKTFGVPTRGGKEDFSIDLTEPYCNFSISYKSIVVDVIFKYRIFARTQLRNLIRAQREGTDPTKTFIRDSSEIEKAWESVLYEKLPKEVSDPTWATMFFTQTFSVLKEDVEVSKTEHDLDVSFVVFDFVTETPAVPFQLGEYRFGFPVSKDFGNTLRKMKGNVEGVLMNIVFYLSVMRTEEGLKSVVKITESHIEQAKSFPSPMLSGKPYAVYGEFLFSEEADLFEELPRQIINFLDERRKGNDHTD